jgi:hypothetical protein
VKATTADIVRLLERDGVTRVSRDLVDAYIQRLIDANIEMPTFVLLTLVQAADASTLLYATGSPMEGESLEAVDLIETAYGLVEATEAERAAAMKELHARLGDLCARRSARHL